MRKLLIIAALTAILVVPTSAFSLVQMVPYGFSYFAGSEGVGTVTTIVGFLDPPIGFNYPFPVDFGTNEYTFAITATIVAVVPGIVTTTYVYGPATISLYEDASQNGGYGTNPPNATAPSSFQDGTQILTGTIAGLTRIDFNFGFPEPAAVGTANFTGGSRLGDLSQGGTGWTFHAGISSNPITGIPPGYRRNWASKITPPSPVPVEETSWGELKSIYADG